MFPFFMGKIGAGLHHLALGCICNYGQPWRHPEHARAPAVDEADEQEEEDGVLQALEDVQPDPGA